jgi:hypothetical protein
VPGVLGAADVPGSPDRDLPIPTRGSSASLRLRFRKRGAGRDGGAEVDGAGI